MSTRILLSFKDSETDKKLLEHLLKKSDVIGKGAYIKQLIQKDMEQSQNEEGFK